MLVSQLTAELDSGNDSSDDEIYDSDRIDSDVEAELYSVLHHQDSLKNDVEKSDSIINISNNEENVKNIDTINNKPLSNLSFIQIDEELVTDDFFRNRQYINFVTPGKGADQSLEKESLRDSLKRKSDLVCNLLEDLQSPSKKQKFNTDNLNKNNQISEADNEVVLLSSDDSDSDIIWTGPSQIESSFQTNVSNNFTTHELDSESNDSWCHNFSSEINTSLSNNKDQWNINHEDLYRYRKISGRYHDKRELTCSKCNQKGHITKTCPIPEDRKCFICGSHHRLSKCKQRICINCHKFGHDARSCDKKSLTCALCEMTGHSSEQCPDLWRKFHLTTAQKFIQSRLIRQNTPLYCYNCGLRGHFGGNCFRSRMNTYSFHTWPTVIDYSLSRSIRRKLKKAEKKKEKRVSNVDPSSSHICDSIEATVKGFSDSVPLQQTLKEIVTKRKKKKIKKTEKMSETNNITETNNGDISQPLQQAENQANGITDTFSNLPESKQKRKRNKRRLKKEFQKRLQSKLQNSEANLWQ